MKNYCIVLLILIASTNLLSQVHWTKHPDNPVMTPGSAGEWDEVIIAPGSVIHLDSAYHMWYWGGDIGSVNQRIGHATSPDGITWTKNENNPVLEPGQDGTWDGTAVGDPTVIYNDSIFHMWYEGIPNKSLSVGIQIGHATSPDGINWTKDINNPVLKKGPVGEWDARWVSQPAVVYNGSEFHMWYTAYNGVLEQIRIGHATSPDGVIWTKDPANPVLSYEPGKWDYPRVDFPKVIFDGNTYQMWYSGGGYLEWDIGYATSEDGSAWTKNANNPVLLNGTAGTWDANFTCFSPAMDSAGVKYKMWYAGGSSINSSGIGYAYSDTRDPYPTLISGKPVYDSTDTIIAKIVLDGTIYIVPKGTSLVIDSITKYMLASVDVSAQAEAQILLTNFPIGHYEVVAVSSLGFVCTNPFFINLVPNAKPPNLDVENDAVAQGDTLRVASDKDGTIYLVIEGTTPDNIILHSTRIKDSIQVTAGIQIGFPTLGLYPKGYLLYAEDAFGQFSEATEVTVDPASTDNTGISNTNSGGIRIFPNPTNDLLSIETEYLDHYSINITSLNGQQVLFGEMEGTSYQINLSYFHTGVYFITVRSEDFVTTRKIIKL